jgi:hypothetical protein
MLKMRVIRKLLNPLKVKMSNILKHLLLRHNPNGTKSLAQEIFQREEQLELKKKKIVNLQGIQNIGTILITIGYPQKQKHNSLMRKLQIDHAF